MFWTQFEFRNEILFQREPTTKFNNIISELMINTGIF